MCICIMCICIYIIYNKEDKKNTMVFKIMLCKNQTKIKLELILKIQVVQRICNPEYVVVFQVLPPKLH